jgi:uncharacterized protein YdaU (DUF1376 family)
MNYYSHHIGDYRRDTGHLSLLEHGVYRQLLDMYYLSEEKIPKETQVVYRRLSAKTEEEKNAVDTVLSEFFKLSEGWEHTRCEREISEYKGRADRSRHNGKLGGRPQKTKVVISGNPDGTQEKANHEPLTINQEPIHTPKAPKGAEPEGFAEFWSAYPNHKAKANAVKAWGKVPGQLHAAICSAVAVQAKSKDWVKDDGQFVPHAATWLNGKRWEDTPTQQSAHAPEWLVGTDFTDVFEANNAGCYAHNVAKFRKGVAA